MSEIKVSIIVPAYNAEKNIYTCVKSIQNQVLEEIEIIVIDDGSNDKTKKIVSEMAKDDKRIRLVQQKKITYMKFWEIKDESQAFKVSLYSDVIKCLDYIMSGSSGLSKNELIKKINYVINNSMVEKYFNFKNNLIFIKAINSKSLYLKIFLSLVSLKKSISIYYLKKIIGKFRNLKTTKYRKEN